MILSIASGKGETGKTTLSTHPATAPLFFAIKCDEEKNVMKRYSSHHACNHDAIADCDRHIYRLNVRKRILR